MNDAELSATSRVDFDLLASRAKFARLTTLIAIGFFALTLLGELGELAGLINLEAIELGPIELIYSIVLLGNTASFLLSVVAISMWIHRAHSTLREAGRHDLQYTPGWAVGWYFIPFANLFKPFGAMRELWSESHVAPDSYGSESPGNLGIWWGAWIIGNILANISFRLTMMDGGASPAPIALLLAAASSVFTIAAAWLIHGIIGSITQAQLSNLQATSVFE
ncbi:MAG: DUF4328 domain-containing protein [Pseudomonadota bacterium]